MDGQDSLNQGTVNNTGNDRPAYEVLDQLDPKGDMMSPVENVPQPEQPFMPQASRPINPAASQPIAPAMNQPINPQASQPINPMGTQPINPVGTQPINPMGAQPFQPMGAQQVSPVGTQMQSSFGTASGMGYVQQQNVPVQYQAQMVPQQFSYPAQQMQPQYAQQAYGNTKFCKYCWATIMMDAVVCTVCGRQVENLNQAQPQQIVINNTNDNVVNAPVHVNANTNVAVAGMKPKDKWIAFILCLFLGYWGVHKFYEGKVGWGLVYLFTGGLCGVGWIIDIIRILLKPNPYYT